MNIAFGVNRFPTLTQTFVINQIQALIQSNHKIKIYASSEQKQNITHSKITEYNMLSACEYTNPPETYTEGVYQTISSFRQSPRLAPLLITTALKKQKNKIANINTILSSNTQYDLFHAHFGTIGRDWSILKQAGNNLDSIPLVVSFYGYDATSKPRKEPDYYSGCDDCFDCLVTVCEDMKNDLKQIGFSKEKMTTVPLGIDTEFFSYHENTSSNREIELLVVARLTEKKGVRYAIDALDNIRNDIDATMKIIGDGPKRETIEDQINQLELNDHVEILGYQPLDRIRSELYSADLLLAPCITPESGNKSHTPAIILQSQAVGTPVISTYHSGIPEIIEQEKTGLLVEQSNAGALASNIIKVMNDSELYSNISVQAREYVEKEHSIPALQDRLLSLYNTIPDVPDQISLNVGEK